MKIAHLADIQVRGLKYHDEFEWKFEKLYESLEKNQVDIVVISGDFYHNKLSVTNEYFKIARKFLERVGDIVWQVIIIPGNHDLSLPNPSREDAISPIANFIRKPGALNDNIHYIKESCIYDFDPVQAARFHHLSILDDNWSTKKDLREDAINIALWHGTVKGCIFQNGYKNEDQGEALSKFGHFDFGMFGDIHKTQALDKEGRFWYCGSFWQQNWGEEPNKGYLLWDIKSKDDFTVEHVVLPQKRYFVTLEASSAQGVDPSWEVPEDSRIRVKLKDDIDYAEESAIKEKISQFFKPHGEPIILYPDEIRDSSIDVSGKKVTVENIRKPDIQQALLKECYPDWKSKELEKLYEIDKKYHSYIDTDLARNVDWSIKSLEWENLFAYGKKNNLDFSKLKGLVGIFGENGIGKSSLIDIILYALFNKINKEGAIKNSGYVNNRKFKGSAKLVAEMAGNEYKVERITKNRKKSTANEVDFSVNSKSLNGEDINETNKEIRSIFGSRDDFNTISLTPQFMLTRFIDQRATGRLETIAKFLDLDIFKEKYELANEDFSKIKEDLARVQREDSVTIEEHEKEKRKMEDFLKHSEGKRASFIEDEKKIGEKISELDEKIVRNIPDSSPEYHKKELKKTKEKQSELTNKRLEILNRLEEISDNEEDEDSLKTKQLNLSEYLETCKNKANDIENLKVEISSLEEKVGKGVCDSCPVNPQLTEAKKELESINDYEIEYKIQRTEEELAEIEARLDCLEEKEHKELEKTNIELQIDNLTDKIKWHSQQKLEAEKNEQDIENNKKFKLEKERLKRDLEFVRQDKESLLSAIAASQATLKFTEKNIEQEKNRQKREAELIEQYDLYQSYLKAMGKHGISYSIISKKIPLINKEVNKILAQIADFQIKITPEEGKRIEIYLKKDGSRYTSIELAGGAEKTISAIAIRCALWKISALPKSNMFFMDEPFGALDSDSFDKISNALEYLKNYFDTVFIITHNEDLKTIVDKPIYLTKDDKGFTIIKE